VIGRCTLDEHTPWEVMRHAAGHQQFPNDVSGDQWFDEQKFNAYTALGRHVGGLAYAAMQDVRPTPTTARPDDAAARQMARLAP
jgi:hypothetical protein